MEIKSNVVKFNERKMVEIPKSTRDNFEIGEEVIIKKVNVNEQKTKD